MKHDTSSGAQLPYHGFCRYKLDLVGYRRLGGTKGAQYEQGTKIFSMVREIKIISWEQDFMYTKG